MGLIKEKQPRVLDCEMNEDKTQLTCKVREKKAGMDFNGTIMWRKGVDNQFHRAKIQGLTAETVDEVEKQVLKK